MKRNKVVTEAFSINPDLLYPASPEIEYGEKCWLVDVNGKKYFDCSGGSGAVNLYHQHPTFVKAIKDQIDKLIHTGWNVQTSVRKELIQKLGNFSPFDECAILLTLPGTEAIEAALKVARAYTGRKTVMAFERAFHGKSSGSLTVTARESFKKYTVLPKDAVIRLPYPIINSSDNEDSYEECLKRIREIVKKACDEGNAPAAFLLEPIQVSEGVLPAGREFIIEIKKLAKEINSLVIFDEIYTGFCRTGHRFMASQEGLLPDILVVGKGLGNGIPVSAVMGRSEIMNALPSGNHSSTFAANPVACAAGCAVLDIMEENKVDEYAALIGKKLKAELDNLSEKFPFICNIRGEGLLIGFDCKEKNSEESSELVKRFAKLALDNGVILRYGGYNGCTIKITPPLLMEESDVEFLINVLDKVSNEIEADR